jgi:hypothetical protein
MHDGDDAMRRQQDAIRVSQNDRRFDDLLGHQDDPLRG